MIVSIIIVLIVALIVIALWVSAVQQHKEKQEIEHFEDDEEMMEYYDEGIQGSLECPVYEPRARAVCCLEVPQQGDTLHSRRSWHPRQD